MICSNVLDSIGNTPLVELRRVLDGAPFKLFGKLEALNPGGSIKDRPARRVVEHALESGQVAPGGAIVESSSGNMGIGMAQACAYHGLRFICVVDSKTTSINIHLLRAYGAEVVVVSEPDPVTGELLKARLDKVQFILDSVPGSYWPNQYANPENSRSHYETTIREVVDVLAQGLDFVFVATSTCGTLRGCHDFITNHGMNTRLVAVDAAGSKIFNQPFHERRIPGLGAGILPPLFPGEQVITNYEHVTDVDCIHGCRKLLRREALLLGGSSGGILSAVERWKDRIPAGATCVAIFPDRGERYLDTIYNDEWVAELGVTLSLVDAAPRPATPGEHPFSKSA